MGATLTSDRFGNPNSAYSFNGTSDYIYVPTATGPNSLELPGSISISAWVQTTNYHMTGQEQIFWRGNNSPAYDQYMFYTWGSNIGLRRDIGGGTTVTSLGYPTTGIDATFHHFVVTFDVTTGMMRIYYDGGLVASASHPGVGTYSTAGFFNVIGAVNYMPSGQYFYGKIDDIGVWNRPLSLCEVTQLYTSSVTPCAVVTVHSSKDTTICATAIPLNITGRAGYSAYLWNNGSTAFSNAVNTSGTYWVHSSSGICDVAIDTFNVTIIPADTVRKRIDTALCPSETLIISAPGGYTSYTWSTGSTAPFINIGTPGMYWVVSQSPCGVSIDTFDVTFVSTDTIITTHDTVVCPSIPAVTLAAGSGYNNYLWSTSETSASITTSASGQYWVRSILNCKILIDTFKVTFLPPFVFSLGNDTVICLGTSITLSPTPYITGAGYSWSSGASTPSLNITEGGTYVIKVTKNGCMRSDTIIVQNEVMPNIDLGPDLVLCNTAEFRIVPKTNAIHTWFDSSTSAVYSATESGTYWCVASNVCGNAIDTINIDFQNCVVGVPTAFSPNRNGTNDILYVRGVGIKSMQFNVYNRFGQSIFQSVRLSDGWDGTYNGQPQPAEVYGYYVKAIMLDESVKTVKGNVTLIR